MSDLNHKVNIAIDRLKAFVPPEGYFLAFSGGKDSVVCKALCDMAGVKYDAHYNVTSVDPPELVRFVIDKHKDVSFDIPHDKDGKPVTMWNLIPRKLMPPTRLVRYCCEELKTKTGENRRCVTGVRWAESVNRAANQGIARIDARKNDPVVENLSKESGFAKNKLGSLILLNDNEENRQQIEHCFAKRKWLVNPIIDWTDRDVWSFIRSERIPYCGLYDDGFHRLGCIGCPMAGRHQREAEFARYPKYLIAYYSAFAKKLIARRKAGLPTDWENEREVYLWWMEYRMRKDQIQMFDEWEG